MAEPARTIVILGLLTGLRVGEILGLKIQDINLREAFVSVRRNIYKGYVQESPKTKRSERQVPLAANVVTGLGQWILIRPNGTEWLFPSKAGLPHHDRNLIRREIDPVCKRLRIPRFGWHSLRHTFSTYNGNTGVPMPVLQSLLGHAHAETTMMYTHPLEGAQRDAVEKLASILFPNVPYSLAGAKCASKLVQ
jgi:integrase